jgi:cell division protein FtsQ
MSGQARIRRGTTTGRGRPRVTRSTRPAQRSKPNGAQRALARIPLKSDTIRRAANYMLGGAVLAVVFAGVIAMQLPQMIGIEIGEGIGRMGFAVQHIEIHGRANMDRDAVYDIAMEQNSRAMPLVDLAETRQHLLKLGWIKDARVSRRLPDTLVVDIVERKPSAIWQNQQKLALIDPEGVVIAPVSVTNMPDLPIVIGPGANSKAKDLDTLLSAAPALKPMLAGASWVGERRWDLRFQSGETLALPEGDKEAQRALADFAARDSKDRLLGQGFVRFDMRVPGRMIVRVSGEPGRRVAEPTVDPAKSI